MKKIVILGIHITNIVKDAVIVQDILTKFGCSIKTRLGLHDIEEDYTQTKRLILLELSGDEDEMQKLENELLKIEGLEVQKMTF
ncbi:MAG: hypothetical protein HXX18_11150 [Bacteroidetes bacterium]|nr:hypothetical protein [Bacteroidota bacterium]